MEAKHTPGPWRLQYNASQDGKGGKAENWLLGRNDHLILKMPAWTSEHGANARLIAAAPDLFHGLEGLLEISTCECDNTHEQNNTVCRVCWAQAVVDRIRTQEATQ